MRLWSVIVILFMPLVMLLGQISVALSFASDTVVIGDPAELILSIEKNKDVDILGVATYFLDSVYSALESAKAQTDTSLPVVPKIADFELLDAAGWIDKDANELFTPDEIQWQETQLGSQVLLQANFTFQLWDPGQNVIPMPVVAYIYNDEQSQTPGGEQAVVFIAPPRGLPSEKDSIDIAPIKPIINEPTNLSDYLVYFILLGLGLLSGLIYWWYIKRSSRLGVSVDDITEPEIYVPPHVKAIEKLDHLKDKELWQKGDIKTYQSELTYIIREYLEGRYGVSALESTTDEILKSIGSELNESGDVISLKRILQVADLVKFAKAQPDENIHQSFMDEARGFVDRTKMIDTPQSDDI
jgi:hypothetical protein